MDKKFQDQRRQRKLIWIINYLVEEDFPSEHLDAISHIIGLFNEDKESERRIFEFANKLYKKYVGERPQVKKQNSAKKLLGENDHMTEADYQTWDKL